MISDILRHYPEAQIDWVVEEAYVDLVRLHPGVRRIIPFALRRWRKKLLSAPVREQMRAFRSEIQEQEYDFVFDTQGLLKTAIVMRMARLAPGGARVGLANATEGSGYEGISRIFHNISIPVGLRTHAVERARIVAAGAMGYALNEAPDFGWSGYQAPKFSWMPNRPYVCFFHGTARASKQWPFEFWSKLGSHVSQRNWDVLLPWGSEDERLTAQRLAETIPNAQVLPKLSISEAIGLAAGASLVVGVDTGLTHVAAAFERPTVEIYCDSPRWKTEGNWSPRIVNLGESGQVPEVAEVIQSVDSLLAAWHVAGNVS